jgi:glutathione S-transferase
MVDAAMGTAARAGIAFEEIQLWFDDAGRIAEAHRYSPVGQVPVLLIDAEPYATAR